VLNDEELEIENEDHNFEVDDDDTVASNEEKDADEEEEDGEGEEEEEEEEVVDENEEEEDDEEDDPRPTTAVGVQRKAVNVPPPSAAVVQSVIKGPPTITAAPIINAAAVDVASRIVHHQRPLPPTAATASRDNKQTPHLSVDPAAVGTPDGKCRRPLNQPKRSPNASAADYAYPYVADAATNAISVVQPPPPPPPPALPIHDAYNRRPPPSVAMSSAGGLKMLPVAADVPTGVTTGSSYPATYHRAGNKIAAGRPLSVPTTTPPPPPPPAYQLSPHVQQVVYDHQPAANYSAYHPPVDYASPGVLPPQSTIAFRNVVVAPPPPQQLLQQQQQQQSIAAGMTATGGDSEFGGLVSYFSSQQEDDFDA